MKCMERKKRGGVRRPFSIDYPHLCSSVFAVALSRDILLDDGSNRTVFLQRADDLIDLLDQARLAPTPLEYELYFHI